MVHFWFGISPKNLCDDHLRGEHNEIHKFIGWLKTGKSIDGWIENNCVQLTELWDRHRRLEREMKCRGMNPDSPVDWNELVGLRDDYQEHKDFKIDRDENRDCLAEKCDKCEVKI